MFSPSRFALVYSVLWRRVKWLENVPRRNVNVNHYYTLAGFDEGITMGLAGNYIDCGSKATIIAVEMHGCDSQPCILIKDTRTHVKVSFLPDRDYTSANYRVRMTVVVPIVLVEGDACENGPLTQGNPRRLTWTLISHPTFLRSIPVSPL